SAQFSITGTPAAGDTFVAEPVRSESIFNTLDNLIAALERPATDANGKAALENSLRAANRELGSALDNVLTVRASVGARLNELDALDDQAADRDIQLAKTLTELQELDYTKAITDLTKQKMILEAAQQSFITTSRLSLFNFI
ncbi:MAG TPA: flagellar hook-associated protein 3, partial [Noviherbaspirillum sp.]|nr:flagellar hook-associated protein 3 [Noviherbaspirillum sp.]